MNLTKFEITWIKADAQYFRDEGFISDDLYQSVLNWLDGKEDSKARSTVASWLERDAEWMKNVESSAMAFFWYFAPAIKLGSSAMRNILISRAKQLKGSGNGPEFGPSQWLPKNPLEGPPLPKFFNIKWRD